MPLFDVTAPDGKLYKVNAPEGATEDEIYSYVRSQMQEAPATSATSSGYDRVASLTDFDAPEDDSEDGGFLEGTGDVLTGALSGTVKAAGAVTSLGSLVPGLHYLADPLSSWLQEAGEGIDAALLSDRQKEINQELSDRLRGAATELGPDASLGDYYDYIVAQGGEAGSFLADHPTQTLNMVAQSIPYIFGGGLITKGVKGVAEVAGLKKISNMGSTTAAGVGEGAITAGEVTKNIIKETDSEGEYGLNRLAAIPAGLITGKVSKVGGKFQQKHGLTDIDVLATDKIAGAPTDLIGIATGVGKEVAKKGLTKKVVQGTGVEMVEETVQSGQEKVFENLGTGKNLITDVASDAVMGGATGGVQGGGVNLYTGIKSNSRDTVNDSAKLISEEIAAKAEEDKNNELRLEETLRVVETSNLNIAGALDGIDPADLEGLDPLQRALRYLDSLTTAQDQEFSSDDGRNKTDSENVINALASAIELYAPGAIEQYTKEKAAEDAQGKVDGHSVTFPNEKEWYKLVDDDEKQKQRIDIANPESELGKAFIAWKNDPEEKVVGKRDNDPETGAPTDDAINSFLDMYKVVKDKDVRHDEYEAALAAHAQFKEEEFTRTQEQIDASNVVKASLLHQYDLAIEGNDLELLSKVNAEAAKVLSPSEWADAKFNRVEETSEVIVSTEGTDGKPLEVTVEKSKDELEVIEPDKVDATALDVLKSVLSGTDIDWSNKGRNKNLVKLVKFLSKALEEGKLEEYLSVKKNKNQTHFFDIAKIKKDAGFPRADAVNYSINALQKVLEKALGEQGFQDPTSAAEKSIRVVGADSDEGGTVDPATLTLTDESEQGTTDLLKPGGPLDISSTGEKQSQPTTDLLDPNVTTDTDISAEKGFQTIQSVGESKVGQMSLYNEDKEYIEGKSKESEATEQAALEELRDKDYALRKDENATTEQWDALNKEIEDFKVKYPGSKSKIESELILSSRKSKTLATLLRAPKTVAEFTKLWNAYRSKGSLEFDKLSDDAKYNWILAVGEFAETRDEVLLKQDQLDIEKETIPVITGGAKDDKANSIVKVKDPESLKRISGRPEQSAKAGNQAESKARADTKSLPEKVEPKTTRKQKKAIKYAEDNIGLTWESKRPRLKALLKKKDLNAFYDFVDKVAGKDTTARLDKAKEAFEASEASEKAKKTEAPKEHKTVTRPTKVKAKDYAKTKLGAKWHSKHPELAAIIDTKDWNAKAFQEKVDSIAKAEAKARPQRSTRAKTNKKSDASTPEITAEGIQTFIRKIIGEHTGKDKAAWRVNSPMRRIHIYQNHEELAEDIKGGTLGAEAAVDELKAAEEGAFTHGGGIAFVTYKDGEKHAFFIIDELNVPENLGVSVESIVMHEIGVHMGMEGLLNSKVMRAVSDTIRSWASRNDGSEEMQLSRAVEEYLEIINQGLEADGEPRMDEDTMISERVAYTVQIAVYKFGINPLDSKDQTPLGKLIRKLYNAFTSAMDLVLNPSNRKKLTIENLVDLAYGAARLELTKQYHVSTTRDLGAIDLTNAGSGFDGANNGFGFNITDRFSSAGNFVKELINRKRTKVSILNLIDGMVVAKDESYSLVEKLQKLQSKGAYLLSREGKKWKPIQWGMFEFVVKPGGFNGQEVSIVHRKDGDSIDMRLDLRNEDGTAIFTDKDMVLIGSVVSNKSGAPNLYTHFIDTLVTEDELLDLDVSIAGQEHVMKFVNSMSKELQALITADNDEGKPVGEITGRSLLETLVLIEEGQSPSNKEGFKLISDLIDQYKLSSKDLSVSNTVEGALRHSAKISALLDKAGIKGTLTNDTTVAVDSLGAGISDKDDRFGMSASSKLKEGSYNKVIFNGDNIVTPGRINMGNTDRNKTVSEKRQYTRFALKPSKNKAEIKKIRNFIDNTFGSDTAYKWDTLARIAKKAAGSLEFLTDALYKVRTSMPSSDVWLRTIRAAEMARNNIKKSVDAIAVQAREMSKDRLSVVNQFIEKATTEQIWPADPEMENLDIKVDKEFNKEFLDKLTESEQKLVMDVFRHGESMLRRKREIAKNLGIDSSFLGFTTLGGPYAPLKRFGNYRVVLKSQRLLDAEAALKARPNKINQKKVENLKLNGAHYVVQFFPNVGQANKFRDLNKGTYASAKATEKAKVVGDGRAPNEKVLEKVFAALKTTDLDSSARKAVEKMLNDIYQESLEETNARHSQSKRKGYKGYEQNMMRSFVSHAKAEANLVANMEYGKSINVALADAYKEANESDSEDLVPVYNLMVTHYNLMLNSKDTAIENAIGSANTAWMLTTSLGYHLQNATQPWMVSYPILAADFNNWTGVLPKMTAGYSIAKDIISYDGKIPLVSSKKVTWQTQIDNAAFPERYEPLLLMMQGMEILDVGIEQDLADISSSDTGFGAFDSATDTASTFNHRLYQAPRLVEAYNRIATAIAAYDLAMENPEVMKRKGTNPLDYAIRIIQTTQGDFSGFAAPGFIKWANNNKLKLAVQYRKFSIMMAWAYINAAKHAFRGANKEEKVVGYKTLAFLLGHTVVLSGVRGLPLIGKLTALYFMLGLGGEEPDTEGAIERSISNYVEDDGLAEIINRGLPSILGLDASMKLSQRGIFDIMPFADVPKDSESTVDYIFALTGPTGANVVNTARAFEYATEGNYYRAIETFTPKGIRSAMEAYRISSEGYSLRNGDIPVKPESFSKYQLALSALGIPTSELSSLKWTRGEQYEITEHFKNRQSEIRKEYVRARKAKNYERARELRAEWDAVQDAKDEVRPFFGGSIKALKRTSLMSLLKAPISQKLREREYGRQLR